MILWSALALITPHHAHAADSPPAVVKPAKPAPGSVQLLFLPPPLEDAVYSVGIYETKTGRLVRRLHESVEDGAFTAGLNGFITFWDRRDDAGKTVPAGKYAARGWAVGETIKVAGVDILGNEWADEDESLRIKHVEAICLLPEDDGLAVLATGADDKLSVCRFTRDGKLVWRKDVLVRPPPDEPIPAVQMAVVDGRLVVRELSTTVLHRLGLEDGSEQSTDGEWSNGESLTFGSITSAAVQPGRDETKWMVLGDAGLIQIPMRNAWKAPFQRPLGEGSEVMLKEFLVKSALRHLAVEPGDPVPVAVSPSTSQNLMYLLESSPGWQRVRGLEWAEVKPDENGQPVSEWKTFFERNIRRPDPALGLDEKTPSPVVELSLAKNPLEPGKAQSVRLRAGFDAKGAYLETADGLCLLPVSTRPNLRAAKLVRDPKGPGRLRFYQFDGAAWDEFAVTGAGRALVSFDAGEFELTTDGEKRPTPPAAEEEPRDF